METVARLWLATIPKNSKSKMLKSAVPPEMAICLSRGSQRMATGMV
jgi:hypothetical protein